MKLIIIFSLLVFSAVAYAQSSGNDASGVQTASVVPATKLFDSEVEPISVTMAGNIINSFSDNITAALYEKPELNEELGTIYRKVPDFVLISSLMFVEKRKWDGDRVWSGILDNELYVAYVPITNSDKIFERNSLVITERNGQEYIADTIKLLVNKQGEVYYGGFVPGAPIEQPAEGNVWLAAIPFVLFAIGAVYLVKKRKHSENFLQG